MFMPLNPATPIEPSAKVGGVAFDWHSGATPHGCFGFAKILFANAKNVLTYF